MIEFSARYAEAFHGAVKILTKMGIKDPITWVESMGVVAESGDISVVRCHFWMKRIPKADIYMDIQLSSRENNPRPLLWHAIVYYNEDLLESARWDFDKDGNPSLK